MNFHIKTLPLGFLFLLFFSNKITETLSQSLNSSHKTFINSSPNRSSGNNVGTVFLIGGALDDTTTNIFNALKQATGKPMPKIAVAISAAGSLVDGQDAYYESVPGSKSYEELFNYYGFQPEIIQLAIDNYETASSNSTILGSANIEIVRNADIVFFNGGDQSRHSRAWLQDDGTDSDIMRALRDRFENGLVIAGTSAGAAVQSDPTYGEGYSYGYYYFNGDLKFCAIGELLADDREGIDSFRYEENGGLMKGFGFIENAVVDTHFDARGRFGRLPVAMKASNKTMGFGVGEDTALYINGDLATAYGNDGVWIIDSSDAVFPPEEENFAVRGLRITYLTEGDTYTFSSKVVTSTKLLIVSNTGQTYQSDDIYYSQEAIKSIKSLVSSGSKQSVGYSRVSIDRKPTSKVVFFRNEGEKAYRSGLKYTVDKMRMDIGTA